MTEQEIKDYCLNNKEKIIKALKSQIVEYPIPDGAWVSNLLDATVEPFDEKKFYEYDLPTRMLCHIFLTEEDAKSYSDLYFIINNAIAERIMEGFRYNINNLVSIENLTIGDKVIKQEF